METKYLRLVYIKQSDSIALLEQIKTISIYRVLDFYKDSENRIVVLNSKELEILKSRVKKYIN